MKYNEKFSPMKIIRTFHGCEVQIEKFVRGSLFGITRLKLPSDAKQWSRGTYFYPHQTAMINSFSCIPFALQGLILT